MATSPELDLCVLFVESLLDPVTGLVAVCEGEDGTSVYHNALAVLAFAHEGRRAAAEGVLDCFDRNLRASRDQFQGFPHLWNVRTGLPNGGSVPWEGDAAHLLLALDYYQQIFGERTKYRVLKDGLVALLSQRAALCELVVAEGVAAMYAAMMPYTRTRILSRLRQCFFNCEYISGADCKHNLLHVILAA
ncbi:MAG: hypothetical protein D6743_14175, partial [Calditrichaeota bacterium]